MNVPVFRILFTIKFLTHSTQLLLGGESGRARAQTEPALRSPDATKSALTLSCFVISLFVF